MFLKKYVPADLMKSRFSDSRVVRSLVKSIWKLSKMSHITALGFFFQDSENLDLLFQAAVDLSTNTKPYDCVTASYLLNFLVYHEGLQNICLGKWLEHHPQMDESTSVSTVEKNTLAGKILGKKFF